MKSLKKDTYPSQVAQIIRTMIQEGELKPGDAIKEPLLASQLSISRAPIREALQELVHEGIVSSEPQKGKRVRCMSAKEIVDSYAVGSILEAAGVSESLPLWSEEDMRRLQEVLGDMEAVSQATSKLTALMELDDTFHATLLQRCDNAKLVFMARHCCSSISKVLCYQKWLTLFSPTGFYERHAKLAEFIYAKDIQGIQTALRAHYHEIAERIIDC
ncbi:MAG: GntR family transcriptional regulator [Desulfovibrionaceae bacterium]|nr:GntR family transcriptional regulator [Desulfovibrionaceae bacterium]